MKLICVFLGIVYTSVSWSITGIEMVKKSDSRRYIDIDNSFFVEVSDIKGKNVQKTKYKVFSKGTRMSLVETLLPERQAGRKLLMKDDDMWFFSPDIKRPTRISMQQRLTGEVANGDIARTNFGDDYSVEILGEEKINKVDAVRLLLKKKETEVTYPIIEFWVAKKDYMPLKAIFKSDSGKALKIATYSEPKTFFGNTVLTKMEIVNAWSKNLKSILIFTGYKKEKLNDAFFNKESLSN